jgi:hypothetical protein
MMKKVKVKDCEKDCHIEYREHIIEWRIPKYDPLLLNGLVNYSTLLSYTPEGMKAEYIKFSDVKLLESFYKSKLALEEKKRLTYLTPKEATKEISDYMKAHNLSICEKEKGFLFFEKKTEEEKNIDNNYKQHYFVDNA